MVEYILRGNAPKDVIGEGITDGKTYRKMYVFSSRVEIYARRRVPDA